MKKNWAWRPVALAVTALVAFAAALAALGIGGGEQARAHDHSSHAVAASAARPHAPATVTRKELAFRNEMRRLWEDHIVWTRLAIVSLTTDAPDTEATVGRLLQNQVDIGDALKPFYGKAAGNRLTEELRRHILIAADVIAAARAEDQAALAAAQERWQGNADDIAAVLHSVNPRHLKRAVLRAEMRAHLDLTTAEVVARLQGDWAADVAAYDAVHSHILHMADYLSTGIVQQFPKRFR